MFNDPCILFREVEGHTVEKETVLCVLDGNDWMSVQELSNFFLLKENVDDGRVHVSCYMVVSGR